MDLLNWALPIVVLVTLFWFGRRFLVAKAIAAMTFARDRVELADHEALPSHIYESLTPVLAEVEALGFTGRQAWRLVSGSGPDFDGYAVEAAHGAEATRAILKAKLSTDDLGQGWVSFATLLMDGREIVTRNYDDTPVLFLPAGVEIEIIEWAPVPKLLERHRARVAAAVAKGVMPLALEPEAARAREQALADESLELLRKTNGAVQLPDGRVRLKLWTAYKRGAEILRRAAARTKSAPKKAPTQPSALSEEAQTEFEWELYRQVGTLQRGRLGWLPKTILMLGSLIVFALFLGWQMSSTTAVVLVAALIVHELGHLAGMWMFGHRDTQLLFLPFFGGAAISMDEKMLKPWQHLVIVFLGPLPGIFIGLAMMVFAGGDTAWLLEAGAVVFGLNAFNLLPILPLDGGRVVETAFAVRFPAVRTVFVGISGLALVGIALLVGGDVLLLILGVFMLIRVPLEWRSAQMVRTLRGELALGLGEEAVVRAMLPRFRTPAWKSVNVSQRLAHSRIMQEAVRRAKPGWLTLLFAAAGFTSPVWLGLPVAFVALVARSEADIKTAEAKLAAAGLSKQRPSMPSGPAVADGQNAAVPFRAAQAKIDELNKATERGAAPEEEPAEVIGLLREAGRRQVVAWAPVKMNSASDPWADALLVQRLAAASERQLRFRAADAAAEIAADGLRLERHLWKSPEWTWTNHTTVRPQLWSALEAALAGGGKLSADSRAALVVVFDDAAYLDFSTRALLQADVDFVHMLRGAMDSGEEGEEYVAWLKIIALLLNPNRGKEHLKLADDVLQLRTALEAVKQGKWQVAPLPPGPAESSVANILERAEAAEGDRVGQKLRTLGDEVARGRMTAFALRVIAAAERSRKMPGGFAEIDGLDAQSIPRHPVSGETLAWRKVGAVDVLAFTSVHMEVGLAPNQAELSWRLPAAAK